MERPVGSPPSLVHFQGSCSPWGTVSCVGWLVPRAASVECMLPSHSSGCRGEGSWYPGRGEVPSTGNPPNLVLWPRLFLCSPLPLLQEWVPPAPLVLGHLVLGGLAAFNRHSGDGSVMCMSVLEPFISSSVPPKGHGFRDMDADSSTATAVTSGRSCDIGSTWTAAAFPSACCLSSCRVHLA